MPYKSEYTHIKLPREEDRRVKLTEYDRQQIKNLFNSWKSQNYIAKEYWVSRRLVYFIIYPDKYEICRQQHKERRLDWRYYDKDSHKLAMRNTRNHRKVILNTWAIES